MEHLDDSILDRGVSTEPLSQSSLPIPDGSDEDGSDEPDELLAVDESLFLQNLSLFYLKLQAKLLLPATTIQTIIEEFQNVHDIGLTHLLKKLSDKLTVLGIPEATIKNIIDEIKKEDLLKTFNSVLNTDQKRKTAFKKNLLY